MSTVTTAAPATATTGTTRWSQLIFVIICMVLIANLQYGWTLFVNPINKAHGLVDRRDPVRLQRFHRAGDLAHPDPGMDRRRSRSEARTEADGGVRRPHGGARVDHQFACREPDDALCRRHRVGRRRRRDLCDERRTCGEVVSGSARPRGRPDCRGVRRRRGADRDPDSLHDRHQRLPGGILLVRTAAGRRRLPPGVVAARPRARRASEHGRAEGAAVEAKLFARRGPEDAGVLAHVHHVRDGLRQRPDGDGADRARSRATSASPIRWCCWAAPR